MNKYPSIYRIVKNDYTAMAAVIVLFLVGIVSIAYGAYLYWQPHEQINMNLIIYITPIVAISLFMATVVLIWRIQRIQSTFETGQIVQGHIYTLSFFRDRGRIEYIYTYQDKKHLSWNAIMKTKQATALNSGDAVTIAVNPTNPKIAFVRELYLESSAQDISSISIESSDISSAKKEELLHNTESTPFYGEYSKNLFLKGWWLLSLPPWYGNLFRLGFLALLIINLMLGFMNTEQSWFESLRYNRHFIMFPILAYFLLQPYFASYFTIKNMWKDSMVHQPIRGKISKHGVVYHSHPWSYKFAMWQDISKVQWLKEGVFLLTVDGYLSMFSPNFFKNERDWEQLKQWIALNVVEAQ